MSQSLVSCQLALMPRQYIYSLQSTMQHIFAKQVLRTKAFRMTRFNVIILEKLGTRQDLTSLS